MNRIFTRFSYLFIILLLNVSLAFSQTTNVVDDYLGNSSFDNACNYTAAGAASSLVTSVDGSTMLNIQDWTAVYDGWSAGASYEYGVNGTFNSSPIPALASDGVSSGAAHGSMAVCAAWGGSAAYKQAVTLPAGTYYFIYKVMNTGPSANGSSLAAWKPTSGTEVSSSLSSFPMNEWTSDTILFKLDSETSGELQLGVQALNSGSGSNARLFFDNVELLYTSDILSNDASLSAINLSAGELVPAFDPAVTNYKVIIPNNVETIEVTPVSANGATFVGGGAIDVSTGDQTIEIVVTAEDGFTKQSYMINFSTSQNYISNWDGNGITGAGSEPDNFGWDCSPAITGWTEANVYGIRFQDGVTNTYNGANFTERILYLRWDGVGGTTTGSVFSFPLPVKACTTYKLTGKMAWTANANDPVYQLAVNTEKDNSGTSYDETNVAQTQTAVLKDFELIFTPSEDGTNYLTIGSSAAVLGAITDLKMVEYTGDPFVNVTAQELVYDSLSLSQEFMIYTYGLTEDVTFEAPAGMTIAPSTISAGDADCGLVVTASFDSKEFLTSGTLSINSEVGSNDIAITEILPPYIAAGSYELSDDGTWCWFQDPRAVSYVGTKNQTYTGWITSKGKVQVASFNHRTGEIITNTISPDDFMQVDDHNNPTILVREDGRIMVAYSGHFYGPMRVIVSTNPEDITSFGEEANFGDNVTYANPYQIGDSTVMLYRDGVSWHPTMNVSMDGGINWGTPQTFITGGGQRPYVKYVKDSKGGIHVVFTTGHPRNEANNQIFYVYYKDGKFYKADGTFIKNYTGTATAINISAGEPEMIYDASKGKGWTWDIALDENERPVVLYAAFPDDYNHNYYYASWDGTKWVSNHIVNSGRWFPQTVEGGTEAEPNYSGGMVLDPNNPKTVYLSKQVNDIFEIYKYTTTDRGANWETEAITRNTPAGTINVRPVVPRGHKPGSFDVMWLRGTYVTYSNYLTSVMYYSPNSLTATIDSIKIGEEVLTNFNEAITYKTSSITIPVVEAFSSVPNATIEITQATEIPGGATIKVISDGGVVTKVFEITFELGTSTKKKYSQVNQLVFPNPGSDKVIVDLSSFENVNTLSVYNLNGALVKQMINPDTQQHEMSIANLDTGLYMFEVKNNEGIFKQKFMKKE